jgi:hypothetical protein
VRLTSLLVVSALGSLLGCYQQPVIPPDKPLSCAGTDAAGECPKGFACIGNRLCAPISCEDNSSCPAGLVCTGRGCLLPTMDGAIPPFTTPGEFLDASPVLFRDGGPDVSIVAPADAIGPPPPDAGQPDIPLVVDGGGN